MLWEFLLESIPKTKILTFAGKVVTFGLTLGRAGASVRYGLVGMFNAMFRIVFS